MKRNPSRSDVVEQYIYYISWSDRCRSRRMTQARSLNRSQHSRTIMSSVVPVPLPLHIYCRRQCKHKVSLSLYQIIWILGWILTSWITVNCRVDCIHDLLFTRHSEMPHYNRAVYILQLLQSVLFSDCRRIVLNTVRSTVEPNLNLYFGNIFFAI